VARNRGTGKARRIVIATVVAGLLASTFWAALTLHPTQVHGQSPLLFGVRPAENSPHRADKGAYFTFVLGPDTGTDDALVVSNNGSEAISLRLYAADGITSINGSTAFAGLDDIRTNVRSWLLSDASVLQVGPGQAVTMPFHVQVPPGALPGDFVAGWVVEAPPKMGNASGGVAASIVERAGVAVVVRVPGPVRQQLVLGAICLNQESGSNYFEIAVRNDGDVLTPGTGSFFLTTNDGQEVFERPAELGNVVPHDDTLLRLDAPFDPGPGRYQATVRLSQPDGQRLEAGSDIIIAEQKVDGCAGAVGVPKQPARGVPILRDLPGGDTPWLLLIGLAALLALVAALRHYINQHLGREKGE